MQKNGMMGNLQRTPPLVFLRGWEVNVWFFFGGGGG